MEKKIIFFDQDPPLDQTAIHLWLGVTDLPHDQLLRLLIGRYLDSDSIEFAKSPTGKLYLPDASLHFNLSDTENWVAIALSWEAPVGIDIEVIRPLEEMELFMLNYFSARERAYIQERERLHRFWEIWNRKEACCKALGVGLQDGMDQWDCYGEGWIDVHHVFVKSLSLGRNLSAAVAICC